MKFNLNLNSKQYSESELIVLGAYHNKKDDNAQFGSAWAKDLKNTFLAMNSSKSFKGKMGEQVVFNTSSGQRFLALGLGNKSKLTHEVLRKELSKLNSCWNKTIKSLTLQIDGLKSKGGLEETVSTIVEAFELSSYKFDRHLSDSKKPSLEEVILDSAEKSSKRSRLQKEIDQALLLTQSVNVARDFVNEPPNVLNSETYAKLVKKDVAKIKGVKVKVLGKKELQKEKAGLFLSVNAGSAYEPQLVHLTYTPKKVTSKTKHVAFVGKGLTFDTGGYSLKPGGSMVNMKFDMAGSATVYGAFRAAALLELPVKMTCILGMTDNAVNSLATMPDSIVKGRNGKSVEILNTDAEGRLVLADCLDYACDLKPDAIIDAATLTGACLVAVGSEMCAVLGNDSKLTKSLLKSAGNVSEYMWELPIIPEFHEDMKSPIADLKNIGGSRFGGTAKAAAFLENFIKNDISWAHLDIAGIGDSQSHLPYCPKKGASGLIIRTLVDYVKNV